MIAASGYRGNSSSGSECGPKELWGCCCGTLTLIAIILTIIYVYDYKPHHEALCLPSGNVSCPYAVKVNNHTFLGRIEDEKPKNASIRCYHGKLMKDKCNEFWKASEKKGFLIAMAVMWSIIILFVGTSFFCLFYSRMNYDRIY